MIRSMLPLTDVEHGLLEFRTNLTEIDSMLDDQLGPESPPSGQARDAFTPV